MSSKNIQIMPIKLRRKNTERCSLLSFHKDTNTENWKKVGLCRENNKKVHNACEVEAPMFGAGSAYRKREREEMRRANFRGSTTEYQEDNQPLLMKVLSDTDRHFKSSRVSGVLEKVDYYIFTPCQDGSIEATPVQDWHNFSAHHRFKHFEAEEAEEAFVKRHKTLNYFALKIHNKLKGTKEEEEEKTITTKTKDLKVSEMDEWIASEDESSDEDNKEQDIGDEEPKKRKKGKFSNESKGKKKKWECNEEAKEDSDDGDEEGREKEYISDSSDSEIEDHKLISVAEEKGLKKLFSGENGLESVSESSSDEDFEDEKKKDEEEDEEEKENEEEKKQKKKKGKKKHGDLFDMFSDSDDEEEGKSKEKPMKQETSKDKKKDEPSVAKKEEPAVATKEISSKEKVLQMCLAKMQKKEYLPPNTSRISTQQENSKTASDTKRFITVDEVRKYFCRKPITIPDLLRKFKSRGIPTNDLIKQVGIIITKLNPTCRVINEKKYYSLSS